jgi:hypothetical protein
MSTTGSAVEQARAELERVEEKCAVASYRADTAKRRLEEMDKRRRLIALEAINGEPDYLEEYAELEEEQKRNHRTLEMAERGIEYAEERIASLRKGLQGEHIRRRFGAEILERERLEWDHERQVWTAEDGFAYDGSRLFDYSRNRARLGA